MAAALEEAYGKGRVEDVDLWVGGLAEGMYGGEGEGHVGHLGPVFTAIMVEQVTRMRAADRFWYEGETWSDAEQKELREAGGMAGLLSRTSAVKVRRRRGGGEGRRRPVCSAVWCCV